MICVYTEEFINATANAESGWQTVTSIGQAVGKNLYYCAGSQGSFDHCGLDGNYNYVSLFCTGNVWQLSPAPFAP